MGMVISRQTLDKITSYLGKRPYVEVFQIFKELEGNVRSVEEVISELSKKEEKQKQPKGKTSAKVQ